MCARISELWFPLLGTAHFVTAMILLPAALFAGVFSVPVVLPLLVWLAVLGYRLFRPRLGLLTSLRVTHFVLAPVSVLLIVYGIHALQAAQRSAGDGGGLLGTFGLVPIGMGMVSGSLALVSLWVSFSPACRRAIAALEKEGYE